MRHKSKNNISSELDEVCVSGTLDLNLLYQAAEDYKAGKPISEYITVDEVEMTIVNDWKVVGSSSDDNGPVDLYAPLMIVQGEEPERMMFDWDIEGFTPVRGHEYKLRVRRFYMPNERWFTHHYEMLEMISDTIVISK